MTTIPEILQGARTGMEKALESTRRDFATVRAGKASANMLDSVRVEMYGQQMQLNQVASVSAPEPRLLIVTPYDRAQAKMVEKAIREADLGLEPSNMGGVIRVPLPSLNAERRKDLVKQVNKYAEDGRIAVRHARSEARDRFKKLDGVSEDDKKAGEKELQKAHDDSMARLDELVKAKEAEIMEV